MPNQDQNKAIKAAEHATGRRYCNNCQMYQPIEKGIWIAHANGLRRRWKCAGCIQRKKERLQTVS